MTLNNCKWRIPYKKLYGFSVYSELNILKCISKCTYNHMLQSSATNVKL